MATQSSRDIEVFVSTDLEADGPVPGLYSMLSLASVAFDEDGNRIGSFSVNLQTLPGADQHPKTMAWWTRQGDAWDKARADARVPDTAIPEYADWVAALPGRPVFVAYPAGFDFPFVCYYLYRFAGTNPFGHAALDIKSYAMAVLRERRFLRTVKQRFPEHWIDNRRPHTHVALDDALEQGELFMRIRRENMQRSD